MFCILLIILEFLFDVSWIVDTGKLNLQIILSSIIIHTESTFSLYIGLRYLDNY